MVEKSRIVMKRKTLLLFLLFCFLFSACSLPVDDPDTVETSQPATKEPVSPSATSTATPELKQKLTVCTDNLPASLFPYDEEQSSVKEHILSIIQDESFDQGDGGLEPAILEKVPTQVDGDLRLQPVTIQNGQVIVDASGKIAILASGVVVRPSGCRQSDCTITWNGEGTLEMDQMVIEFNLRGDLLWSDGTVLTAGDSIFSYELASAPEASGLHWAEDRTAAYTELDETTIRWVGLPGFTSADPGRFFWTPLPSHLFSGEETWEEIAGSEQLTLTPLSYGPFILVFREDNALTFESNPFYYKSGKGLPKLDEVTFRVVEGGAGEAWTLMKSGGCDVLDSSLGLEGDKGLLAEVMADERYDVLLQPGDSWTQLVFGIQPAAYDGSFSLDQGDRPDFFGDERTRQAIAMCLDREAMLETTTGDSGTLWASFLSPDRSQLEESDWISYDLETSIRLLNEAGWRDHDENPETPLQAWEVPNVPVGTQFIVGLAVSQSAFHQDLAEIIRSSLQNVGILVEITTLPAEVLYAPGPGGILFGRQFDMTLLSWQPASDLDCSYYLSWQVPSNDNQWIGTNIAGLANTIFDQLCSDASLALPDEYANAVRQAENAYLNYLPAVPLLSVSGVMAIPASGCSEDTTYNERVFYSLLESFQTGLNEGCR
jgi:peptide/nickel transport system substrate-binding protein